MKRRWMVMLATFALLATSVHSFATPQGVPANTPDFVTDSPEFNEKLHRGSVKVTEYIMPSESEQAQIDQELRNLGYPEGYIAKTPVPLKEHLAVNHLPYTKPKELGRDFGVMTLDSDGWMSISFSATDASTLDENKMILSSTWDWHKRPEFRLFDKIGISWVSDNVFGYDPTSITNVAWFYGCTADVNHPNCRWNRVEANYLVDSKPGAGEGVEIEMLSLFEYNGEAYFVRDWSGAASIAVKRARNHTRERRTFSAATGYFHKQGICNGSLSFGSGLGIGINCVFGYSESSQPTDTKYYTD